jgi:hypothetical protein
VCAWCGFVFCMRVCSAIYSVTPAVVFGVLHLLLFIVLALRHHVLCSLPLGPPDKEQTDLGSLSSGHTTGQPLLGRRQSVRAWSGAREPRRRYHPISCRSAGQRLQSDPSTRRLSWYRSGSYGDRRQRFVRVGVALARMCFCCICGAVGVVFASVRLFVCALSSMCCCGCGC